MKIVILFIFAILSLFSPGLAAEIPQLVLQTGHGGYVSNGCFSPVDGRLLATTGDDGRVVLWDVTTGRQIKTFASGMKTLDPVTFNADGSLLAAGGSDRGDTGAVKVWNVATGELLHTFKAEKTITALANIPESDGFVSGDLDGTVAFLDLKTGSTIRILKRALETPRNRTITNLRFIPGGRRLFACGFSPTLWDIESGSPVATFETIRNGILWSNGFIRDIIPLEPDKALLIKSHEPDDKNYNPLEEHAFFWSLAGGVSKNDATNGYLIRSVALFPGGTLAAGLAGDRIVFFNAKTGKVDKVVQREKFTYDANDKILASPDGRHLAIIRSSRGASLYDRNGRGIRLLESEYYSHGGSFSSEGSHLFYGKDWDIRNSGMPDSYFDNTCNHIYSQNNKYVYVDTVDKELNGICPSGPAELWEIESRKKVSEGLSHLYGSGSISPVGSTYMSAGWGEIKISDIKSGSQKIIKFPTYFHTKGLLSADGKSLFAIGGDFGEDFDEPHRPASGFLREINVESGSVTREFDVEGKPLEVITISPGDKLIAVGGWDGTIRVYDSSTSKQAYGFTAHDGPVTALHFNSKGTILFSGGADKMVRQWQLPEHTLMAEYGGHTGEIISISVAEEKGLLFSSAKGDTGVLRKLGSSQWLARIAISKQWGTWAIIDPDGRFDTNNLEEIKGLHWVMPDDPLTPVPIEAFMLDYYEPRLLDRLLKGEELSPVKPLMETNRIQPEVTVDKVAPVAGNPSRVKVTVTARQIERNGKRSGLKDLRLFRSGQLVGYLDNDLPLGKDGSFSKTFTVTLPAAEQGRPTADFTAYAFNSESIKSATSKPVTVKLPEKNPPRRAYILSIGVGSYANPSKDLLFPPTDATAYSRELAKSLAATGRFASGNVIPVLLTNNGSWDEKAGQWKSVTSNLARREIIKGVFDLLAGRSVPEEIRARIPEAGKLKKVTPDDLVIITFSGHGLTIGDDSRDFILSTSNDVPNAARLGDSFIASSSLANWLRDIDAGEMGIIIDACHSAAAVGDKKFKPGPMGSRGLGQLAYDKGIKILAGTQADNKAWEYDILKHGLLTYTLLEEGLKAKKADYKPQDGSIDLKELLSFGVEQVPKIQRQIKNNTFRLPNKSSRGNTGDTELPQQPALFDFRRQHEELMLFSGK